MSRYSPGRGLALITLIGAIFFALSPLVSTGFNGFTPTQFPIPQNDPPVQPAGYAFSIWGLIYVWLIAGAVYGMWKAADHPDWQPHRLPLVISLGVGMFWIPVAQISPVIATLMIFVMLAGAVAAFLRAGHNDRVWQVRPIALYAGWLTAASGVALGVTLAGYGVMGSQMAAILCLILVLAVALMVQHMRIAEWGYPLAVIWALIGVIIANLESQNGVVIALSLAGIVALVARFVRDKRITM